MSDPVVVLASEPANVPPVTDLTATVERVVGSDLAIESVEVPSDPRMGVLVLRGRLTQPSHNAFHRWLTALRPLGYTPMLRHEAVRHNPVSNHPVSNHPVSSSEGVELRIFAGVPPQVPSRPWINLLLFLATVVSTLFVGSLYGDLNGVSQFSDLFLPQNIIQGWPFSFTLLGILVAHEFGHYFAARYHKVAVTLPFFIPLPVVGFGTLGAFIRLKEPVPDRRKLFDIGVAGPLAGLIIAIPLLFLGLSTSPVDVPPMGGGVQLEGNSILYYFAKIAVFGKPLPDPLTGQDVFMNQITFAAWIGLLVTALNLLPVGQLDGGHTVYALFGRAARYANVATLVVMGLLAIAGLAPVQEMWPVLRNFGFAGWWMWLGLIIFVLGPYHPPALDDVTQLDGRRRLLGYVVILCFILTFVPTPFREL